MSDTMGDTDTSVADLARLDGGLIQALRACGSDEEMEEICGRMIVSSPWVAIDPHAVSSLIPLLSDCQPISWSWLCDPRSITDTERFFDLALNASLNGGYFWSPSPGTVSQWQVQGSGSQALQDWLDLMRAQGLLPGHDRPGGSDWDNRIRTSLIGQPYASQRLDTIRGFADPQRRSRFDAFARECLSGGAFTVNLASVDRLAAIYPEGFAADPFRKKAILAFLLMAGCMSCRGTTIKWDAAFPVDYQLPRGCAWHGVITLSPETLSMLHCGTLLPIDSELVCHLRAATLVAVQSASRRANVPSWLADGALFNGFRRHPRFTVEAPPPMRVDGSWF